MIYDHVLVVQLCSGDSHRRNLASPKADPHVLVCDYHNFVIII